MASSLIFESVARTHVGLVRELNEDAFVDRPLIGLWAVADGMGGHQAGEVASGLIAEALHEIGSVSSGYTFLDEVRERLSIVNRTLVAKAGSLSLGSVIGSTVVVLLAYEGHYACLWAGDSRAYLMRGGVLRPISRDHSVVQELIDSGNLSVAAAKTDKRSNVITRAVGVHPDLVLDVLHGVIEANDVYLLCSDGLTGLVDDDELAAELGRGDLASLADRLIQLALDRGARDNVTVVLVRAALSPDDTYDQSPETATRLSWP
jgi:serine/threonine protein phosphatase PrpC